ncbi:MAG: cytochrome b/b6 domain-containing protein [Gammaproteobacteria bacterium]|nr:cytochrome b/b6 domain-containing protein [Gammaproteobacteria bacterium]
MQLRNTPRAYGLVARLLHWSSVALLLFLYLLVSGLDVPPKVHVREAVVAQHVALGLAFGALMLARLAWRLANPNPALAYGFRPWRRALVVNLHRLLYAGLFVEVALGLFAHAAAGGALPLLGQRVASADASLATACAAWHDGLARGLLLLVTVHATVAVINQAGTGSPPPAA